MCKYHKSWNKSRLDEKDRGDRNLLWIETESESVKLIMKWWNNLFIISFTLSESVFLSWKKKWLVGLIMIEIIHACYIVSFLSQNNYLKVNLSVKLVSYFVF